MRAFASSRGLVFLSLFAICATRSIRAQGINEFALPVAGAPAAIAVGSDGALWFTDLLGKVGRITQGGAITEYTVSFGAMGIVSGPDGALWFAESGVNKIGRMTTAGVLTEFSAGGNPEGITVGPDGALWFTEILGNNIGRITTAGVVTEYPIPTTNSHPLEIVAGPDGALWFTENLTDKIGRVTTSGAITEYPVPGSGTGLYGITSGPDGNLWFNESNAGKIGRITTSGGITEFPLPETTSNRDITVGPDGNLWITELDANKIARLTTAGVITEFLIPTSGSEPWGITAGPDGNIWFTEFAASQIGQLVIGGAPPPEIGDEFPLPVKGAPAAIAVGSDGALWFTDLLGKVGRITQGGAITEYTVSFGAMGIVSGPDGALWFAESGVNKIGRMTTAGALTEFSAGGNPEGITVGPDGALWFTEILGNNIGRITTAGVVTEYPIPTTNSHPLEIVAGPDGALWFTENLTDKIGRVTTSGAITEYPVPGSGTGLYGITSGPDGNLWFNESNAGKIGRITTSGGITEFPLPETTSNRDITVGPDGNLWITELDANKIARLTTAGVITEFLIPTSGSEPWGITAGPDGNIWFTEFAASQIGRVNGSCWPAGLLVDSAAAPGSSSNANGILEPGETVLVEPSWLNETISPMSVTGTASKASGPAGAVYSLVDTAADYGTVPAKSVGDCGSNCYLFSVSNPAIRPKAHWDAVFTERLSNTATKTWVLHVGDSFADVPESSAFYRDIETIFHDGVTAGCSNGDYCPGAAVTRAQMAVFLLKAKHGSSYAPPACTGVFQDVACPGGFAVNWIEQLYAEGITGGCNASPLQYCPSSPVTRAQMAVFLLKGEHGSSYAPPACTGIFGDVACPGGFAVNWIEQLYREGITGGCQASPLLYCSGDPATRGQMAVFLTKTFNLKLYGP